MEKLIFQSPKARCENDVLDFAEDFVKNGSKMNGANKLQDYLNKNNYEEWVEKEENGTNYLSIGSEQIPANTFFVYRLDDNKLIGIVNIRSELNDHLLLKGGHIGYSVRPSERRKGYATEILRIDLRELMKIGITKALITCDKDNIGSAKTIQNNNGILENEIFDKDKNRIIQRYWIESKKINANAP